MDSGGSGQSKVLVKEEKQEKKNRKNLLRRTIKKEYQGRIVLRLVAEEVKCDSVQWMIPVKGRRGSCFIA